MNTELNESGYILREDLDVWARPDYQGIAYSDGDEVENRIKQAICSASDRSVLSRDLRAHCVDWPSFYHLTSSRANIIRPFEDDLRQASVLEIGAGCGAITRYLGEIGARVVALEGSLRRAEIARARCQGLSDVTVVADNFGSFQTSRRFDFVTLIGVLEYAAVFIEGENPAQVMLEKVRALLKPGGRLLVAIENKVGLKYFAGALEDHHGRRMYGVESRYRPGEPRTYGKSELLSVMTSAGFRSVEFLCPFPDYKVPSTIITESGLNTPGFDSAALIQHSIERDRQLPAHRVFAIHRVWRSIVANRLASELSNSFLVVASGEELLGGKDTPLAWHYNTDRIPAFCKKSEFSLGRDGAVTIASAKLSEERLPESLVSRIEIRVSESSPYYVGRVVSDELGEILSRKGWKVEDIGSFVRDFVERVLAATDQGPVRPESYHVERLIPGELFDALPTNVIKTESGQYERFDSEWVLREPFSLGWLVFRILLLCLDSRDMTEEPSGAFERTHIGFIRAAFHAAGLAVTDEQIRLFGEREAAIQSAITGGTVSPDFWNSERAISPHRDPYQEIERVLSVLRDAEARVAERDQMILEREREILRQKDAMRRVTKSFSWRVTGPLRGLSERLRGRRGSFS